MKKQTLAYTLIGAMLVTSVLCGSALAKAEAAPQKMDRQERMAMKHEKRLEMMSDLLDLTEAQQEQIRTIHERERVSNQEARQQRHNGDEEMRRLLESQTFDESAIRSLAIRQANLKAEMFVAHARVEHEVFQLLNADQQVLAKKIQPLLHKQGGQRASRKGL